ncbi:replication protein A [Archaeoglobales archaeon]|nr:MAG: replication protein A [Archaeoglobales archaeon]
MSIEEKIEKLADQIHEKFKEYNVSRKEILKRLKLLIIEFKVPESEAVRTITNYFIKELEIPREAVIETQLVKIADIDEAGRWVSLKAKVVQLWDTNSPSISQAGLIGDETGMIKFVVWAKAGKPEVEEEKCYLFRNVVTDIFAGRRQVNITKYSEIIEIDEDITLPPREIEVVGALVAIQQNSGLIQRCEECGRVMKSGLCSVHGKAKWREDLRIKGVLDDGENVYEIILNEENIKSLTGIDLEKARKMAEETLDRGIVLSELKKRLLGKYLKVQGVRGERYLIVKSVDFYKPDVASEVEKLLEAIG